MDNYKYLKYKIKYYNLKAGAMHDIQTLTLGNNISMKNINFSLKYCDDIWNDLDDTYLEKTVFYIWCLKDDETKNYLSFKESVNKSIIDSSNEKLSSTNNLLFYSGNVSKHDKQQNLDICVYFECIKDGEIHKKENESVKLIVDTRYNYRYIKTTTEDKQKEWSDNSKKFNFDNIEDIKKLIKFIKKHSKDLSTDKLKFFTGYFSITTNKPESGIDKICCKEKNSLYYLIVSVYEN